MSDAAPESAQHVANAPPADVTARAIELEGQREQLLLRTVELQAMASAAEEASRAKSVFLATMSHELRTPINAVLGYAQLLDIGIAGSVNEGQREYLARIASCGQHLLGLVNEVLDLAQIEAGGLRVLHVDALTGPAILQAVDLVRPQAALKSVRLVDDYAQDDGEPFVGDEDRVRQIVLNLLSNAVKFTPEGGTVTINCSREQSTPPEAGSLSGSGPWTAVRVIDTGVGIVDSEQGRVFEAFHQVDGEMTRQQGGTGLGLAISRRLARMMGGDLTLTSVPDEGSTFTLWLPAAREDRSLSESADERTARSGPDYGSADAPGLCAVGDVLRQSIEDVLVAYTDRLRAAVPLGPEMRRTELEDHAVSFLADLAQSLIILSEAGAEAAELLRDGSAIQRTIAEHHGARRCHQGWDLEALHVDHDVFRTEIERVIRIRLPVENPGVEAAVIVLQSLINRSEAVSVRAWHRTEALPRSG